MGIHITKDNFVWLDITNKMKKAKGNERDEIWVGNEIFALHDDDSESLIESQEELEEAINLGLKIGIEVGHIPTPTLQNWSTIDKKLIDGFWYAKISELKLA